VNTLCCSSLDDTVSKYMEDPAGRNHMGNLVQPTGVLRGCITRLFEGYLPYRVSGSTLTAVGRSWLLGPWPGTHSRILSGIRRAAQTVLGVYLNRTCSRVTGASSALGVLNDYALYKSTHSLTHSLICKQCTTHFLTALLTRHGREQWGTDDPTRTI